MVLMIVEGGVLSSDLNVLVFEQILNQGNMDGGRSHHNIDLALVKVDIVEDALNEDPGLLHGIVGLPVSSNEELASCE